MTMTVKELIEALSEYPDDAPVITEGCDCYGDAGSVEFFSDNEVLICRGTIEDKEKYKKEREAEERRLDKRDAGLRAKGLIA